MRRLLLPSLLLSFSVGCGDAGSPAAPTLTPAPSPPAASLSIAVRPDPVLAADTGDPDAPLRAEWQVRISEGSGVGGRLSFVNATLRDGASGAEAEPSGVVSMGAGDIVAQAGTNRVEPGGSLTVTQALQYDLPSGGRAGILTVTVQFVDDAGNLISRSAQAAVG